MTHVGPAPVSSRAAPTTGGASFVEWGAVLAGAVLAAAITFVLLAFGAAIGLSATSPWPNSGVSAKVIASLAVFWAMAAQIGAFMVGGYVAGRMRSRWHETSRARSRIQGRAARRSRVGRRRGHRCRIVHIGSRSCGKDRGPDRGQGRHRFGGRFHERPDGRASGYDDAAYDGRSGGAQLSAAAGAPPGDRQCAPALAWRG